MIAEKYIKLYPFQDGFFQPYLLQQTRYFQHWCSTCLRTSPYEITVIDEKGNFYSNAVFCCVYAYVLFIYWTQAFKSISLFHILGRIHPSCQVEMCSCEPEAVSLLRHGLWPLSPKSPKTAVAETLLGLLHSLTLDGQVSVAAFVDALKLQNEYVQKVGDQTSGHV